MQSDLTQRDTRREEASVHEVQPKPLHTQGHRCSERRRAVPRTHSRPRSAAVSRRRSLSLAAAPGGSPRRRSRLQPGRILLSTESSSKPRLRRGGGSHARTPSARPGIELSAQARASVALWRRLEESRGSRDPNPGCSSLLRQAALCWRHARRSPLLPSVASPGASDWRRPQALALKNGGSRLPDSMLRCAPRDDRRPLARTGCVLVCRWPPGAGLA